MATAIPPALKAADIVRFAQRAGQIEKAKPAVAYWCNYWIVEQILAKGLHKADDDCKTYTMGLMDRLEQTKADFSENDAIVDEVAGQAYVEQFGLEIFQKAENAMKVNKATRQTADTFQAAATFLDLCQIWGPLDSEIASKIKFAKYHALRIAKAFKAGEDPNLSNPTPEPEQIALDPDDPEVRALNTLDKSEQYQDVSRQPTVVEAPDESDQVQGVTVQDAANDQTLQLRRAPSGFATASEEAFYHLKAPPVASSLSPSDPARSIPENIGYFPRENTVLDASDTTIPDSSLQPFDITPRAEEFHAPSQRQTFPLAPPGSQVEMSDSLHSFPPPALDELGNVQHATSQSPHLPSPPLPFDSSYPSQQPPALRHAPQTPGQPSITAPIAPIRTPGSSLSSNVPFVANQMAFITDEEAIVKAQKHARWAISALNFEDVNTAVQELKGALEALGVR